MVSCEEIPNDSTFPLVHLQVISSNYSYVLVKIASDAVHPRNDSFVRPKTSLETYPADINLPGDESHG